MPVFGKMPTLLCILALALSCRVCTALDAKEFEGWTHHTWSIADGLPDQSIESVAQTPDGYLWLGTPHGLSRFDGRKFEEYMPTAERSIHEFGVSCMLVSREGDLWVGSVGGGLTKISQGGIQNHYDGQLMERLTVRMLYQDEGGTIWAGTGNGLYRLMGEHLVRNELLGNQTLTSIAPDGAGGFWVAGIQLFHFDGGRFAQISLPYQDRDAVIHGLAITNDGDLWIGTPYGLIERGADGKMHTIPGIPHTVRSLHADAQGRLWIATLEEGLFVRRRNGAFVHALGDEEPMSKTARAITHTANGDVWVGTTAGLLRLSETGMNLIPISTTAGSDFGSLYRDSDNSIYLSAGRLTRFSNGLLKEIKLPVHGAAPIRAYYRDSTGAVWLGTLGDGVYRYSAGATQHFPNVRSVRGFEEARDGTIWIANDGGIAKWRQNRLTVLKHEQANLPAAVRAMAPMQDGSLWVGTAEGLFLVRDDRYVDSPLAHRMARQRIWSLHAGGDGSLWIGTESGLYIWKKQCLIHVEVAGWPSTTKAVLSVLEDTQGRVLIAQPATVLRIARADFETMMQSVDFNRVGTTEVTLAGSPEVFAIAKETGAELYGTLPKTAQADLEGGAWFASYLGLIHIQPVAVARNEPPPPIKITEVKINGVAIPTSGLLRLSPAIRNIQIESSIVSLGTRPGLRLRRRLKGFENEWSDVPGETSAIYGKLPPGRYTYQIEARWLRDSRVSSAEIELIQEAAFYRQPWFTAVCCSFVVLVVWSLYQLRLHQMEMRFQIITEERSRVAREMHDTLLQGCIGISALLEAVASGHEKEFREWPPERGQAWRSLFNYARVQLGETIKNTRTSIWNIRNAEDKKTLGDTLSCLLRDLTESPKINTSFAQIGDDIILPPDIQHEVTMATREAVLNAVTHAHPSEVTLTVANMMGGDIVVTVSDDGEGFEFETLRQHPLHFGLKNMKERMEKLGGICQISSSPGCGSQVELQFNLRPGRSRSR